MLKEAKDDEILRQADRTTAAASKRRAGGRPSFNYSASRGQYSQHGLIPDGHPSYQQAQPGESGNDSRGGRGQGGRGSGENRRYGRSYSSHAVVDSTGIPSIGPVSVDSDIGARWLRFAHNWGALPDDQWILNIVSNGVLLDFVSRPTQRSLPRAVEMTKEMQQICDIELRNLLEKKAVIETVNDGHGFVRSFFCIPKKGGAWRPIGNLKPLNYFIRYEKFKIFRLVALRRGSF